MVKKEDKICPLFNMAQIIGFCIPEGYKSLAIMSEENKNTINCLLEKCEWYDEGNEKCSVWSIQKEIEILGRVK